MHCRDRKQDGSFQTAGNLNIAVTPEQSLQSSPLLEDLKLRASNQITAVGSIEAALGAAAVGYANYELVDKVTHQKLDEVNRRLELLAQMIKNMTPKEQDNIGPLLAKHLPGGLASLSLNGVLTPEECLKLM